MEGIPIKPGEVGLAGGLITGLIIIYKTAGAVLPKLVDSWLEKTGKVNTPELDKRDYRHAVVEGLKEMQRLQRETASILGALEARLEKLEDGLEQIKYDTRYTKDRIRESKAS